jgi:hypothetical protein
MIEISATEEAEVEWLLLGTSLGKVNRRSYLKNKLEKQKDWGCDSGDIVLAWQVGSSKFNIQNYKIKKKSRSGRSGRYMLQHFAINTIFIKAI